MREPTKSQQQAISHFTGPAQVIAGPGSGKTFTIIQRILHLIHHHGISPDNILVLTYTKAAANEMLTRFTGENINAYKENIHCGTFHSICLQILKQTGMLSGFELVNDNEKRNVLSVILKNLGYSEKVNYETITDILHHFSRRKNLFGDSSHTDFEPPMEFSKDEFLFIQKEYHRLMEEQKKIDFDDIIIKCLKLLQERPTICQKYQNIFQFILVDEFQDINLPQYQMLKMLSHPKNNIFVVGDDDQAIYGFRGASPGIMQQFMYDYTYAKQILLTENFRCAESIVTLSNKVIIHNQTRFLKQIKAMQSGGKIQLHCFDSRREEETALCQELISNKGISYQDTAIILRTNLEALQYFEVLKKQKIPVKEKQSTTQNVFSSFIFQDILSFLSYIYDGRKRSDFIQFMNKPNHYFSRMSLPAETVSQKQLQQYYALNATMLSTVKAYFRQLYLAESLCPYLAVNLFRKSMGYDNYLNKKATTKQQQELWQCQLQELHEAVKKHNFSQGILDYLRAEEDKCKKAQHAPTYQSGVTILTMHGAKGLEFDTVFLPDVNEGIIPGKRCVTKEDMEEERRLLYVAITRAKNMLYMSYTKERNRKISRYLDGIMPLNHQEAIHQIPHCQDTHQTHLRPFHIPHHLQ